MKLHRYSFFKLEQQSEVELGISKLERKRKNGKSPVLWTERLRVFCLLEEEQKTMNLKFFYCMENVKPSLSRLATSSF